MNTPKIDKGKADQHCAPSEALRDNDKDNKLQEVLTLLGSWIVKVFDR